MSVGERSLDIAPRRVVELGLPKSVPPTICPHAGAIGVIATDRRWAVSRSKLVRAGFRWSGILVIHVFRRGQRFFERASICERLRESARNLVHLALKARHPARHRPSVTEVKSGRTRMAYGPYEPR